MSPEAMTRGSLQFVPGLAVWVRTELSRDDDEGELGVMNAEDESFSEHDALSVACFR